MPDPATAPATPPTSPEAIRLAAIRERVNAAPSGPWWWERLCLETRPEATLVGPADGEPRFPWALIHNRYGPAVGLVDPLLVLDESRPPDPDNDPRDNPVWKLIQCAPADLRFLLDLLAQRDAEVAFLSGLVGDLSQDDRAYRLGVQVGSDNQPGYHAALHDLLLACIQERAHLPGAVAEALSRAQGEIHEYLQAQPSPQPAPQEVAP